VIDKAGEGEFRCIKCGQLSIVTKTSDDCYRYSIKCTRCGHGGAFTQDLFDYVKAHDGYFPMESLGLSKSSILTVGTGGKAK